MAAGDIFAPKNLVEALRLLQGRAGMSREELAKGCGVSAASMSNYFNGTSVPSATVLRKISNVLADRLGLDPVHLWVELGMLIDVSSPSAPAKRPKRPTGEAIHRVIEHALATGDVEEALELCSDEVVLHVPGRNPFSGEYMGKEGISMIAELVGQLSGGEAQFKAELLSASDQHTMHVQSVQMMVQGEVLDTRSLIVCYLREGKISEVWVYPEDQYLMDNFWESLELGARQRKE